MSYVDTQIESEIVTAASAGQVARNRTQIDASVKSRRMTPYQEPSCQTGKAQIGNTLRITGFTTAAATADPEPITKGILAMFSLITGLFGKHHAQAVATEQGTLCDLVPQLQGALDQADQGYKAGKASDALISDLKTTSVAYKQSTQGIWKECNAACFFGQEFDAQIEIRRRADYAPSALGFAKRNWPWLALGGAVAAGLYFLVGR